MMYKKATALLCFIIPVFLFAQQPAMRIWYQKPAAAWEEYLPLGNGRLGIMPDGGVFTENIVLNDISLWSGKKQNADLDNAYQALPNIRHLLAEGKNIEAQKAMSKSFVCKGKGSGEGNGADVPYGSYQVLANLTIKYDYGQDSTAVAMSGYTRQLSLDSAIATTDYHIHQTAYHREYVSSFHNDVIIIKLSADKANAINCALSLSWAERAALQSEKGEMILYGNMNDGSGGSGMGYITRLKVKAESGNVIYTDSGIRIQNATAAYIYISAGTDYETAAYKQETDEVLNKAMRISYIAEKQKHIQTYRSLFSRAAFRLGKASADTIPTDKRLQRYYAGNEDNYLPCLYFQFGRYLLISSTRPGLLPPNLQGLWANTIQTPWNGDYHLDINIQMNHWPLDVTNLSSLNPPFFNLVNNLVKSGEHTAKAYYDAPGWVAFVITNIWGYTSPGEDYSWGAYNTGSAWLCQMLWEHYEFAPDADYLRKIYPVLKGSAEFYLNTLVTENTHGWLVTSPSNSPENTFLLPGGQRANVCEGPTIDNQIVRYLFNKTIEACRILRSDDSLLQALQKAVVKLPPTQIGPDGRIMEWLAAYKEEDMHHRHTSHLWGLYPGNEISVETPALAEAARKSLDARGDEGTGWSLAWKVNFWARLHDGNRALKLLKQLLKPVSGSAVNMSNGGGTYPNLFCAHPPFQIDGNFGGTAGIAEMLVQSNSGYIEVLPALPDAWSDGSFNGLQVRGGAQISAEWSGHQCKEISLVSSTDTTFKIKIPASVSKVTLTKHGVASALQTTGGFISVSLKKNETVMLNL